MYTDYILSCDIMTVLKTLKIKLGNILSRGYWLQDNFDKQKENLVLKYVWPSNFNQEVCSPSATGGASFSDQGNKSAVWMQ